MDDTLEDRIAAVERALTDGDHDLAALAADGDAANRIQTLEDDVAELDDRVAELEAATQALRGYVGNVRAVNEEVRERADLALETARDDGEEPQSHSNDPDPTLTLETDQPAETDSPEPRRRPGDTGVAERSDDDPCPLCDGDSHPSPDRQPSRDTGSERRHGTTTVAQRNQSQQTGQRCDDGNRGLTDGGLTDGGFVQSDGSEETDAGVLTSIRSLL